MLAGGALRPELDAAGDYVFTNDDPDREAFSDERRSNAGDADGDTS
ncbi:hypothetical protein [Agromyces sp. CCNWLW203]